MIAAASLSVMLAACAPVGHSGGREGAAPTLTADRYVAADGTALPLAVWPAARGAHPKAVILGLHGFGDYRNALEEPAEIWAKAGITTYAYDQRGFGKSPTRGRWPGTDDPGRRRQGRGRAAARPLSRRAALSRGREHGRRGGPGRRRSRHGGRRADPERSGAALARLVRAGRVSGGLWFFAHTIPWMPAGPTSIDFKPTDNPKTLEKLQNDPLMLRQPRLDMGYGLVDLMDAARDFGRAGAPALPDAARPGRPHRAAASR